MASTTASQHSTPRRLHHPGFLVVEAMARAASQIRHVGRAVKRVELIDKGRRRITGGLQDLEETTWYKQVSKCHTK